MHVSYKTSHSIPHPLHRPSPSHASPFLHHAFAFTTAVQRAVDSPQPLLCDSCSDSPQLSVADIECASCPDDSVFLSVDYYQRFWHATIGVAAVDLRIVANSGTLGVRNFRCALLTSAFSAGSLAVSPAPICLRMWRRNNGSVATITHVPPSS